MSAKVPRKRQAQPLARSVLSQQADMRTQTGSSYRLRIELEGDFWGHEALSLAERLPLSDLAGARCVVLSLAKVGHIDEAGLAMLVRLYSHLRIRGSELELVDVPAIISALLDRVGFRSLVSYAEDSDDEQVHYSIALGTHVEA